MITGNILGHQVSALSATRLTAVNPATGETLPGAFSAATREEVDAACQLAWSAARPYGRTSAEERAVFLEQIAANIEALGDELIHRAMSETGLPLARLTGERGRTTGQLRLFANFLRQGHWVEAIIEQADPQRQPLPKPDVRRMLVPVGPVVVFGASNFPLAFSTAGGDTASALAAGCPVIVKGHESHLGTHALVAEAIQKAVVSGHLPEGVFSALNGYGASVGQWLVEHPRVKSVAFTGSQGAGLAILRTAQNRPEPIPVFAEMGSVNPVILFPGALQTNHDQIAGQLATSLTLGGGQFCTNPGLVVMLRSATTKAWLEIFTQKLAASAAQTMLNAGILANYERNTSTMLAQPHVTAVLHRPSSAFGQAAPALATVDADKFLQATGLHHEVFGPFALVVLCTDQQELAQVIEHLEGQLTGTVWADEQDLAIYKQEILQLGERCGRLLFNGVPTGVEVCHAMQHGGPYPATTDSRYTSVGTAAIKRFCRPLALQNCPAELLPPELQDHNPRDIFRLVNGEFARH